MLNRGSFIVLQDSTSRLQVYVNRKTLPEETLAEIKTWDLGDIIGAEGTLARSGKGDLYVDMTNVRLLTKSLRPLPDKHHGLTDIEQRYRQRYVDLIVNEETRHTFRVRSQVIAHIRRFLSERGFLEVETPMLLTIPGGAAAKPFATHHNALDMAMFLRIAPDTWLVESALHDASDLLPAVRTGCGRRSYAVTDISDSFVTIVVEGAQAPALLARGCGLDFSPLAFGQAACARTRLAQLPVVLRRVTSERFDCHVDRSAAQWLYDWMEDAAEGLD